MEKNKIALILWFSFLFTAPVSAQMMTEQEADALFESLSNWGRWGAVSYTHLTLPTIYSV